MVSVCVGFGRGVCRSVVDVVFVYERGVGGWGVGVVVGGVIGVVCEVSSIGVVVGGGRVHVVRVKVGLMVGG